MKSTASRTPSDVTHGVRRLGYLSGAPRVTTRSASDAAGPRAHVLGVIGGFEHHGWEVARYIVGDRMPTIVARDGEAMLHRGKAWTLAADMGRLALRRRHASGAWTELGRRVDCVYERFALFQALGAPFAAHGVPWVLETNAMLTEEASRERAGVVLTGIAARLERDAYHACTLLVAISDALAERLVDDMDVPRDKILVVPNGVDVDRFDPARVTARRLGDRGVLMILFVGSLAPWQGLDTLFEAMRDCGGVRAVIAGDGPARAALERQAVALGLDVRFLGRVPPDDVPSLIAGADVCYSGHSAFRSPLKLYEYMAMGTPVVSSSVPDAVRAIADGETGFLFSPGDVTSLTQALRAARSARDHLPRMGARARAEAVAHHSWDARVGDICERLAGPGVAA